MNRIRIAAAGIAVLGLIGLTTGIAQAGDGCCSKKGKTTTSGSSCATKGTQAQMSGSCGAQTTSAGWATKSDMGTKAGCAAKAGCATQAGSSSACGTSRSASACDMKVKDCEKMLRTYYKTHGWLGAEMPCSGDMTTRPTVTRVHAGSPAETAGFKVGDELTSVNGIGLAPENLELLRSLWENGFRVGDQVRYTVIREGQILPLQATLRAVGGDELAEMIAYHVQASHPPVQKAESSF